MKLDGNSAERRAIWSREDPSFFGIVYLANPSSINYKYGMAILKESVVHDKL